VKCIRVNTIVCDKSAFYPPRNSIQLEQEVIPFHCIKRHAELRKLPVSRRTSECKFWVVNRWHGRVVYIKQELAVPIRLTPFIARSLPDCISRQCNINVTTGRTPAETNYIS